MNPYERNIMPRTTMFASDFKVYEPISPTRQLTYDAIWGLRAKLTLKRVLAFHVINRRIKENCFYEVGEYVITITPGPRLNNTLTKK